MTNLKISKLQNLAWHTEQEAERTRKHADMLDKHAKHLRGVAGWEEGDTKANYDALSLKRE